MAAAQMCYDSLFCGGMRFSRVSKSASKETDFCCINFFLKPILVFIGVEWLEQLNLYVPFTFALGFAGRHGKFILVTSPAHTFFFIWLANEEELQILYYYTTWFQISLSECANRAETSGIQPRTCFSRFARISGLTWNNPILRQS